MTFFTTIGYASTARAPWVRACSTAASARARATPRLRYPALANRQVTYQTDSSSRSSSRPSQWMRNVLRSSPWYAGRGSTAHQPTGS